MKALTRFSIAVAFVLAMSFTSFAHGQDGGHKHPAIESELATQSDLNEAQSASIESVTAYLEALTAETRALRELVNAQPAIDAGQDARLRALEDAGPPDPEPEPPVEPDPIAPWPVWLVDLSNGAKAEFFSPTQSVGAGVYTVEVDPSAKAPVSFKINGAACGNPENNPPIHACGDNNPAPLVTGQNTIEILASDGQTATLSLKVLADPTEPPDPEPNPVSGGLQAGPWFSWVTNPEQPYNNILAAGGPPFFQYGPDWSIKSTYADLVARGLINPETGLPKKTSETIDLPIMFDRPDSWLFDGEWVFEVECGGAVAVCADLTLQFHPSEYQRKDGNRITFLRDKAGGKTPSSTFPRLSNIKADLTAVRIYRVEDEAGIRSGENWRSGFVSLFDGYSYIRTMDLQGSNGIFICSADQIPPSSWEWNGGTDGAIYQGPSFDRLADLASRTNTALWVQFPAYVGVPESLCGEYEAMKDYAKANAADLLESPEFDRMADKLVAALVASGYPSEREFILSASNEVWNWVFKQTSYFESLGRGLYGADYRFRFAYGRYMARVAQAMEGALARAGRTQNIRYVIEGQAAWPDLTRQALTGAKEQAGAQWDNLSKKFGVSVASYWGSHDFTKAGIDPNDLPALEDWLLNGPDEHIATKAWILRAFAEHDEIAKDFGLRLIAAYEGGSHFERPSGMTQENYESFVWGEYGGRINTEINAAILKEFPGFILSNYGLCGSTGGQPWFEGPCGADNPYAKSWEPFKRKGSTDQ